MKSSLIALLMILTTAAQARCVVEILDNNGDPLGHVFQGDSCAEPQARCQQTLARLRNPEAKCEVTLDIGSKAVVPTN